MIINITMIIDSKKNYARVGKSGPLSKEIAKRINNIKFQRNPSNCQKIMVVSTSMSE